MMEPGVKVFIMETSVSMFMIEVKVKVFLIIIIIIQDLNGDQYADFSDEGWCGCV